VENKELQRRLREHKGRRLLADLKERLERLLDCEINHSDFVGVQATEQLRAAFFERIIRSRNESDPEVRSKTCEPSRVSQIWEEVADIASCVGGMNAVLLHRLDEFTGAVIIPARIVLARARDVWEFEGGILGGELCLCSMDATSGFHLDFNHYYDRDEYELTTWGVFARCGRNP